MKVFIDNNLSPRIARSLQALFGDKHEIVCLKDKFPENAKDIDWIKSLSEDGKWVVISGDQRITKNKAEKLVFKNSKLIGFFMSRGFFKKGPVIQVARLLLQWNKLEDLVNAVDPGAAFQITETRIKQI
jgi:hypothetical protein